MKLGPIVQFVVIGGAVGIVAPFVLSLCLFGSTLPVFIAAEPTPGYWSGAPTPAATAVPSHVQVAMSGVLHQGGAVAFVFLSIAGALGGEALGDRWPGGHPWHRTRRAWMGAILGGIVFSFLSMLLFMP